MNKPETLIFLLIAVFQLSFQEGIGQVTGSVTDANQKPLPLVNVSIMGSERGTQTDPEGKYNINASRDDILLFSHLGMQSMEVHVKRSSDRINVEMQSDTVVFEEVEIKAKYQYKTQKDLLAEYLENKRLIKTVYGIINVDNSPYAMRIIEGENLVIIGEDLRASLLDHFPQRRLMVATARFEVDGFLYESVPPGLNSFNIERVAVLGSNAAIAKYGPIGVNGIIIVNTKTQALLDDKGVDRSEENIEFLDSLMRVTHLPIYHPYESPYFEKLKKIRTEKKALAIYETQKKNYLEAPFYFLDVYDYFLSRWGSNANSQALFQDVRNHLPDSVPELKALAYLQQKYGNFESASDLYIQILLMKSWEGQTLRNVANAFVEAGDIKKAWMYYTQYIEIQNQLPDTHFDAYGADMLITTDMMGILDVYNDPFLNNQDIESTVDDDMRTRLVFEWNDPEAGFALQIITPEGYYDTWEHHAGNNISQDPEIVKGYCSKQFFLGKENLGLWQVNINGDGNSSELPTYLKVSIYRNFGLASQQLNVKVFNLSEIHDKVQLFTFQQY